MQQFNLFGYIEEPAVIPAPEPEPQTERKPFKKRLIGDNFVVVKCLRCSQMIMVDPEYYDQDDIRDKICEACNEKYFTKFLKYLKLKL